MYTQTHISTPTCKYITGYFNVLMYNLWERKIQKIAKLPEINITEMVSYMVVSNFPPVLLWSALLYSAITNTVELFSLSLKQHTESLTRFSLWNISVNCLLVRLVVCLFSQCIEIVALRFIEVRSTAQHVNSSDKIPQKR